jgi:prepilin-type processing-associated H-X9-DG protein
MLWGIGEHANNWEKFADKAIAAGSKHLLAFNEPDHTGQANIGFADAASAYLQYMQPYAGKVKLGSPAVTNGGSPMGLAWLESFLGSCTTCTVDFIAIHWYNGGDASAFKEYVQKAYKSGGNRPVVCIFFD